MQEFDRQVEKLILKGYPDMAFVRTGKFAKRLDPLKKKIRELASLEKQTREGRIPFVIVVNTDWVAADKAMRLVEIKDKQGYSLMSPDEIKGFKPVQGVTLPIGMAYLVLDVDTGKGTLNVTPDDALKKIRKQKRSPLTIAEGVALITHYPEILRENNCFSMLGSRGGDRRVTALWISGGRPRLGWCWAGNPHSWLGSAACGGRIGL